MQPIYENLVKSSWLDAICQPIEGKRALITLDGPCASGKTTLAQKLAERLDGILLHTDDYVVPHAMKTPEW